MKFLLEYEDTVEFLKLRKEAEEDNILWDVVHYKANLAQYKRFWDSKMERDSYPNKNTSYTIPNKREETDETYPYQTFGGLVPLTDREKQNLEDN